WWTGTIWPCGCVARGPRSCPWSIPDRRVRSEGTVVLVRLSLLCGGALRPRSHVACQGAFGSTPPLLFCEETGLGNPRRRCSTKGFYRRCGKKKGWGGRRAAPPGGSGSDPDRYGPRPSYSRGRQRQNLPAITANRDLDRHGENMRLPLNGMIIVG